MARRRWCLCNCVHVTSFINLSWAFLIRDAAERSEVGQDYKAELTTESPSDAGGRRHAVNVWLTEMKMFLGCECEVHLQNMLHFYSTTDGEVLRRPEVQRHRSEKHSHTHTETKRDREKVLL